MKLSYLTPNLSQHSTAIRSAFFGLTPDLYLLFSDKGQVLEYEGDLQNLFHSPEEFDGLFIADFLPSEIAEKTARLLAGVLKYNQPQQIEWILPKMEQIQYAEVRLLPAPNHCILGIIRNITRHTEEKKALENEMLRLDRLNTVGEMAASLGHEIRNPMTSIRGFLQLLQRKPHCQPFQDYFSIIIEELDQVNRIITEFLSLAKNKTVDLTYFDLNQIIKALYPLLQADAVSNNQLIELHLDPLPAIRIDDKEIRQLLLNLCRNGLESMPSGGKLEIRTFCLENRLFLEIKDQGPGIPLSILEKLGTPFLTTKENGSGLGLAVCYRIAARHDAAITVDSSPQGTTFRIAFQVTPMNKAE